MTAVIDLENLETDNPEALLQAFASLESGDEPSSSDPKTDATPPAAATETQPNNEPEGTTTQQGSEAGQQTELEPQGVATKDGKHVIPYTVLKSERERAIRAEQLLEEAQQRLAEIQAAGNQGTKPGESVRTEPQNFASDLSPEDLELLKEDFPTVFKAIQAAEAKFQLLESKLQPVENSVRQSEAERAQSETEMVQDAIDAIPKLSHIQATDAAAFNLAIQFDATLREQPAWAGKPISERFQKATEMVEAALGEIKVPGQEPPTAQKTPEQLKAEALATAANATKTNRTNVPNSLSEAPAGTPAAQDEREAADQMSALQLAEKFSSMTPDQMDAYFRTL